VSLPTRSAIVPLPIQISGKPESLSTVGVEFFLVVHYFRTTAQPPARKASRLPARVATATALSEDEKHPSELAFDVSDLGVGFRVPGLLAHR
jgi:hypothetical protein